MRENDIWNSYYLLHKENPRSDSEAKVNFYNQNSEFIIRNSENSYPELAIIIPAYNESNLLPRTLASINQSIKDQKEAQVFVVNNASTDDTAEIAKMFGAKVINESKKGIGQARQTGLESVPNSIKNILTTDADTVVSKNWVNSHKTKLENQDIVGTYGIVNFTSDNLMMPLLDRVLLSIYTETANLVHIVKNGCGVIVSGGSNTGYKKDIAIASGGYNKSLNLGEDTDLMERISHYGDIARADCSVLTSARRINNEGIIKHGFERLKNNFFDIFGKEFKKTNNKYEDYR